ncbi:50S ribosomal protein L1 [Tuwongella immobilis]|uniref:50S ribosomal protein L1 n=1 Tax=Tuwongella immobilis TaxID=692036 RepID=UPI001E3A1932|nr:50S ribosomal protein L1 [Tuwongella immobilis]
MSDSPTASNESTASAKANATEESTKRRSRPGYPPRRGRKLRAKLNEINNKVEKEGTVAVARAVQLLKSVKRVKFDETVEVHIHLGIDTTQSDQMVRGSVSLPHGIGKSVRVVVFCQGENVAKAKEAGADFAGSTELIEKIQKENWLDFDVALATQDLMGQVSRLGKILGPRSLMPTPKAGTVVPMTGDLAAVVREFKAGKVEYRADKSGNLHVGVGKLSFDEQKLVENVTAFVEQVRNTKPTGVKGNYIHSITLSATMSPGVRLSM